jgi:hypothetical protein
VKFSQLTFLLAIASLLQQAGAQELPAAGAAPLAIPIGSEQQDAGGNCQALSLDEHAELERLRKQASEACKQPAGSTTKHIQHKKPVTRIAKVPGVGGPKVLASEKPKVLGNPPAVSTIGNAPQLELSALGEPAPSSSEKTTINGLTQIIVNVPNPPAPDTSALSTVVQIDSPRDISTDRPFSIIARIRRTHGETDLDEPPQGFIRTTVSSKVPVPVGIAMLSALETNAASIEGPSQEFFVPPGFSAMRVWTVTAHRAGPMSLQLAFDTFPASAQKSATEGSKIALQVRDGRKQFSTQWILWAAIGAALLLVLGWFAGSRRGQRAEPAHDHDDPRQRRDVKDGEVIEK